MPPIYEEDDETQVSTIFINESICLYQDFFKCKFVSYDRPDYLSNYLGLSFLIN